MPAATRVLHVPFLAVSPTALPAALRAEDVDAAVGTKAEASKAKVTEAAEPLAAVLWEDLGLVEAARESVMKVVEVMAD